MLARCALTIQRRAGAPLSALAASGVRSTYVQRSVVYQTQQKAFISKRKDREPSIASLLIPQHIENFPFPEAKNFAEKIEAGKVKGKMHVFVFDMETTGITRKELPRILEMCMEKLDVDKDFSEDVAANLKPKVMVPSEEPVRGFSQPEPPKADAPPAAAADQASAAEEAKEGEVSQVPPISGTEPETSDSYDSGTFENLTTDEKYHAYSDPGIPSSIYAWDHHKINRSDVRGKPTIAETFPDLINWSSKRAGVQPDDVCVLLMPHFAKLEKITLAYELTRAKLDAPPNWIFVNATNILEKQVPELEKVQLSSIFTHLFGSPPYKVRRADADVAALKACLQKCFPNPNHFREAILLEMKNDVSKFI